MFSSLKHVHIVGIGGIGVSAIAKLLLHRGIAVSGSDTKSSDITKELESRGVLFKEGNEMNIPSECDLLIFSPAVPETDLERMVAAERGIKQLSYPEVLGVLSKQYSTIAVSGTNGKSTTTAMLGLILEAAGYDPTVIVGSKVPGFPDGNLRLGKGRFFVVEACEHQAHMLHLEPEMIVLTNIEADHLDYYRDLEHIRETFQIYVDKMKGKGLVIWNADDPVSQTLSLSRGVSYGRTGRDYHYQDRKTEEGKQMADIFSEDQKQEWGILELGVPGEFNLMNALAAASAATELGVPTDIIRRTLTSFTGIWRRFERVGNYQDIPVISDYGHHPTAISGTIAAAREFFPGRRIVLCFQPHQHARTKALFSEFVDALATADLVIIPEIYYVRGRTEDQSVSSQDLVQAIHSNDPDKKDQVIFASDLEEMERCLRSLLIPGDVLLIQGAGDIDKVARHLAQIG